MAGTSRVARFMSAGSNGFKALQGRVRRLPATSKKHSSHFLLFFYIAGIHNPPPPVSIDFTRSFPFSVLLNPKPQRIMPVEVRGRASKGEGLSSCCIGSSQQLGVPLGGGVPQTRIIAGSVLGSPISKKLNGQSNHWHLLGYCCSSCRKGL